MELSKIEVKIIRSLMNDVDGLLEDMSEDDSYDFKVADVKKLAEKVEAKSALKHINWDSYAKYQEELSDGD